MEKLPEGKIRKLREFDSYIRARRNIKESTRGSQLTIMMLVAEELDKPFEQVTKEEMQQFIGRLQKRYMPSTLEQKKLIIKRFWRWLEKPEVVSWIKLQPNAYKKVRDPKSLWTPGEIKKEINAFSTEQHQALVAVLYESEARISELLSMNICDVEEQGDAFRIWLRKSKTKERSVWICNSKLYLKKWLKRHPYRNNPNHPLWISYSDRSKGKRLKPVSVNEMLNSAQQRSGVNKKISPHLLRHSMASYLRRKGYPDANHTIRMGLRPGSPVLEQYSHISELQANREYLKMQGVKFTDEEPEGNIFEPIKCWKCGTENPPTSKYCDVCNSDISVESAERDFNITEVFKTRFPELYRVDVDRVIREFKHFQTDTGSIEKIFNCFNGGDAITNDVVRRALQLSDDSCLELLQYLQTAGLIQFGDTDTIYLKDRQRFKQFLTMQRRYLEINKN